jgi:hypothetical protein
MMCSLSDRFDRAKPTVLELLKNENRDFMTEHRPVMEAAERRHRRPAAEAVVAVLHP